MNPRIQVGVVPYLNSRPLVQGYQSLHDRADFRFLPPSRLAVLMAEDRLDVALVSCVEYLRGGRKILPDVGIVSRGSVNSVLLMGNQSVELARTVNLDPDSLTSCALVALWFRAKLGREPIFSRHPLESPQALACDARLAIGDSALRLNGTCPYQLDMGAVWEDWIGHPFVYAVWLVRDGVEPGPVARFLRSAPSRFEPGFTLLAQEASRDLSLDERVCVDYLTHSLQFALDSQALAGMECFLNLAAAHHLWLEAAIEGFPPLGVTSPVELRFCADEPIVEYNLPTGS